MRLAIVYICLFSVGGLVGCVYREPPRRVVYRDVIAPDGTVIEHDRIVDAPPAPIVEVVPVRPYVGAVWVRGYWVRRPHRWIWVRGYWQ